MNQQIKASEIQPGMVVMIYGGAERIAVEGVSVRWDGVQICDHLNWRGLGRDEPVTVAGYFNPE